MMIHQMNLHLDRKTDTNVKYERKNNFKQVGKQKPPRHKWIVNNYPKYVFSYYKYNLIVQDVQI